MSKKSLAIAMIALMMAGCNNYSHVNEAINEASRKCKKHGGLVDVYSRLGNGCMKIYFVCKDITATTKLYNELLKCDIDNKGE